MNYLSVCSGIEAATVAWHPLGWTPAGFAEIEKFPSAVLAHHYPGVKNYGDFTNIPALSGVDLLVGGTPCQSFSVAGLRKGLDDERGNLALEYFRLAERCNPRWLVWENVPGVLSSSKGRDFGSILGAMVELGYGFAYRVLDAQHFGVPQRRRRVFLIGYLGDWRRAAAVLFESPSVFRDIKTRRKARDEFAGKASSGFGGNGPEVTAFAENSRAEVRLTGQIMSSLGGGGGKPGQGYPAIAFHPTQDPISSSSSFPPLQRKVDGMGVATSAPRDVAHCLAAHAAKGGDPTTDNYTVQNYRVRRLTPRECERLQGFPDDYTAVPGASASARYKALGNSMAVPCMRWIGERIKAVDALGGSLT